VSATTSSVKFKVSHRARISKAAEERRRESNAQVGDVEADEVGRDDVIVRVQDLGLFLLLCLVSFLIVFGTQGWHRAHQTRRGPNALLRRRQHLLRTPEVPHPPICRLSPINRRELEHPTHCNNGDAHPVRGEAERQRTRDGEEGAVGEDDVWTDEDFRTAREEGKDVGIGDEDRRDPGGRVC
jgi:hypothetical protein